MSSMRHVVFFSGLALVLAVNSMGKADTIEEYCQQVADVAGGSYQVKEVCVENELKAKARLEGQNLSTSPKPTSLKQKPSKPRVGDYVCKGGVPCDHSDVE